jgi:SnoaL-like polyketide cyclase
LSQTFGADRIVEEMVMRFTHTIEMDWILPGVRPTHRSVEFALAGIIRFEAGKIASEHLCWDQATLLSQIGVPDHPTVAAGIVSAAELLKLLSDPEGWCKREIENFNADEPQYLTGTTDEFAEQKMNSRTTIQTAADAHAIRAIDR